jgi:PKD repeat protein
LRRSARSHWPKQIAAVALTLALACTSDKHLVSPPKDIAASATPSIAPPPEVLVGAGNIATCSTTNDDATAALLDNIAGTVYTTGDNIYGLGTLAEFQTCYGPSWGRHKARTRPAVGNKEYQTAGAAGHWQYFGAAAGDSGKYYYSYDLGAWHVVVLNSQIDMTVGSAQEVWLKADLAASAKRCTVALWDQPRFSSSGTSVRSAVKPLWDALYAAKADLVLNAHYRVYERFAPQTPAGAADPVNGIRQFTVGTGGSTVDVFGTPLANSEVRATSVYGVLKLTLADGTYSWQFLPIAGQTFTDQGTGSCHRTPPTNQAPTANPSGPYTSSTGTVTFDGSGSSDPDNNLPLAYTWAFGDGTQGTGVAPAHSYAGNGTYTVTLTVTDALGTASTPATTTATIATPLNNPPVVNAGSDVTVGVAFNLSATFSDLDLNDAPWTYQIVWGDGGTDNGGTATQASAIRASHIYATSGSYTVRVTVTDKNGGAASDDLIVTVANTNVLVGAADIADCGVTGDEATAALLDAIPGTVFTAGDNVYPEGDAAQFTSCYHLSWGRHLARTRPAAGNHDYLDNPELGAADYFKYFGPAAGDPTTGWYSYDLGAWHVVVLNSNLSMTAGSPQEQWLLADLAASTTVCTLAYWHHPRFSSGSRHGNSTDPLPVWRALYQAGAEIVISGHDHQYERFAPQTPEGFSDPNHGIREFIVGTGGKDHYGFGTPLPTSEVRDSTSFGVLKLTLRDSDYDWQFIPVAGASFSDAGSGSCHGTPPPNAPPVAKPSGPYSSTTGTVTFDGGASSDPDNHLPLTYAWTFGDGTTGSGVTPTHSYVLSGTYTVRLAVMDALGASSGSASTTATISMPPAPVASVDVSPANASIQVGGSIQLTATPRDANGNALFGRTITWATDNPGVATVDGGGVVTGAAVGTDRVSATSEGQTGVVTITVTTAPGAVTFVGAGNIASCSGTNDDATATLLDNIAGTVFTTGDNIYGDGSPTDFQTCYGPAWGRHKARTRPAVGNKEYQAPGAGGYWQYFGAAAGDSGKYYYSYDLGAWHVVVLNSQINMAVGSPQEQWLKTDLAASTKRCTVAIWDQPRFSSSGTSVRSAVKPLWDALYAAKAELVLNAHYRVYERFAPQTPAGAADPVNGIRQFTVGTGGSTVDVFGTPIANSEVRATSVYGVLKLTLADGNYTWQFIPIAGQAFTDSGSGDCH